MNGHPADPGKLRELLLSWYDANRRDLPWRRSRDPYAIWISETMLQQTRVETVIPYYERFLERFPGVEALATADIEDVLELWAGLGYYSRARNLQKAAQQIVDELGSELPQDADSLRTLPGVGRYTAGAVASIAFDRPEPIVDGNVMRVLTRLHHIREDVSERAVVDRLWEEATRLARGRRPGDLNQALMELGATLCTPRAPRCSACPLAEQCGALRAGDSEQLPVKSKRTKVRRVRAVAAWVVRGGHGLAVRRPAGGLLGGLWELPGGDIDESGNAEDRVRGAIRDRTGLELRALKSVGTVDHTFTHRQLALHVFRCETRTARVKRDGFDAHRWVSLPGFESLAQAALTRKALTLLR